MKGTFHKSGRNKMQIPSEILSVIGEYYVKRGLYNRSLTAKGGFGKEAILYRLTVLCRKHNIVCVSSSGRFIFEENNQIEEMTETSFPGFVPDNERLIKR